MNYIKTLSDAVPYNVSLSCRGCERKNTLVLTGCVFVPNTFTLQEEWLFSVQRVSSLVQNPKI